ncbi:MAG: phenylalanine--tRNA ligase subunit beta [Gammaproteobacteria bacterium]|nr:phenylalanine--tRNA ligase subunit beta [Gammaproteobacteria bacterium]
MKISEQWLREWVDPKAGTAELAERLTMAGFEVESIAPCAPELRGVVVARVIDIATHPRAARLKVCTVDAGGDAPVRIVCGAPNVTAGGLYALASPGSRLALDRTVESASIEGVTSHGMLCSAAELGLGDDAGHLLQFDDDAVPGEAIGKALRLDDSILELAVTANRGDCLCVAGIARELSVLYRRKLRAPRIAPVAAPGRSRREVRLEAPDACPRYAGRVVDGVDVARRTPLWLREKLRRADLRSINIIVDITNFVMLELGQPMHAFDDDRLRGAISARLGRAGETLRLLDGRECSPGEDVLVIADESGAVALAGIMGGQDTAVNLQTRRIFLESAFFSPLAIAGRARRFGLQTDASQRFERSVDPEGQCRALERATDLLLRLCGGTPGPVVDMRAPGFPPPHRRLKLRSRRLERLLGARIGKRRVESILGRLGMGLAPARDGWEVEVPPERADLILEADLVEEVARIHGYDRIPSARLAGRIGLHHGGADARFRAWRRALVERGYFEAITYSFVPQELQGRVLAEVRAVPILNPISADLSVLRCSLLPGLLQALQFNLMRQQRRVRLFEIGRAFLLDPGLRQPYRLAAVAYGNPLPEQWDSEDTPADFYDMKSDIEALLPASTDGPARYRPSDHPALNPAQSAEIYYGNQSIGYVGGLHPRLLASLEIAGPVQVFELLLERLEREKPSRFSDYSRFPSVRRDLAVVVDKGVPAGDVLEAARSAGAGLLRNLELFDVYEGEGIDLGKKSLALGLTFQKTSSTLIEEEVEAALGRVLTVLREKFGGTLRQ